MLCYVSCRFRFILCILIGSIHIEVILTLDTMPLSTRNRIRLSCRERVASIRDLAKGKKTFEQVRSIAWGKVLKGIVKEANKKRSAAKSTRGPECPPRARPTKAPFVPIQRGPECPSITWAEVVKIWAEFNQWQSTPTRIVSFLVQKPVGDRGKKFTWNDQIPKEQMWHAAQKYINAEWVLHGVAVMLNAVFPIFSKAYNFHSVMAVS